MDGHRVQWSDSKLIDNVFLGAVLVCFIKEGRCDPAIWSSALHGPIMKLDHSRFEN